MWRFFHCPEEEPRHPGLGGKSLTEPIYILTRRAMVSNRRRRYFNLMPKSKRPRQQLWEVIRLTASPAKFIGSVYAADEGAALKQAIAEFHIRREDQKRLLVRRAR